MGCLIALLLVVCLVVGRGLKTRCGSASYSVQSLETHQKSAPPSTINPVTTGQLVVGFIWNTLTYQCSCSHGSGNSEWSSKGREWRSTANERDAMLTYPAVEPALMIISN